MFKRAIDSRFRAMVLLVMVASAFTGCEKYYYITEADRGPICYNTKFTCTINNNSPITGTITNRVENGVNTVTETSPWAQISRADGQTSVDYDFTNRFTTVECFTEFNYDGRFYNARYDYSYMIDDISAEFNSSGRLTKLTSDKTFFTSEPDYISTIESITYNDDNITAYRYKEKLSSSPFTEVVSFRYAVTYDLTKKYNPAVYPNDQFFAGNPRPILDEQYYSLGEIFDPQVFSTNLVTRKRNTTTDEDIFEKEYQFDGSGRITQVIQNYLMGGPKSTSIKWQYEYSCD